MPIISLVFPDIIKSRLKVISIINPSLLKTVIRTQGGYKLLVLYYRWSLSSNLIVLLNQTKYSNLYGQQAYIYLNLYFLFDKLMNMKLWFVSRKMVKLQYFVLPLSYSENINIPWYYMGLGQCLKFLILLHIMNLPHCPLPADMCLSCRRCILTKCII